MSLRKVLLASLPVVALLVGGLGPSSAAAQNAGVIVDPQGVLRTKAVRDPSGQLTRQRLAQAKAALNPDIARPSKLRKVSLNRLEAEIARRLKTGAGMTDDMKHLAGLTRLEYVFFYPETGDIVIAGPAEGYGPDLTGRMIGVNSGQATLLLEDLVVALRAFAPGQRTTRTLGVSIDPTKEGLARLQQFLARYRPSPNNARQYAMKMREALGLQTVSINGVSPKTHFAQVLTEADYRMKLIGIALERPPVKITSYVQRANPAQVAANAMERWYFVPDYRMVKVTGDKLAMQLEGDTVKLVGANELVTGDGRRIASRRVNLASKAFCDEFTRKYPELAKREPVYAQLRNLIDMSVAAAFIQQQDFYGQAGWRLGVLADEQKFPVETYQEPKQVETAVNAIWKGRTLMTPIGGGVRIQPHLALASDMMAYDTEGELKVLQGKIKVKEQVAAGRWWWD